MSRSALFVSLVIHASILTLVGWSSWSSTSHAGLGKSETGVSFSIGPAEGLVSQEGSDRTPPEQTPENFPAAPVALPSTTVKVDPASMVPSEPTPLPITTTTTLSQEIPTLPRSKKAQAPAPRTRSSGSKNTSASDSTGTGEPGGSNLAGTGRGAGGGAGYIPPQFLMRYKPPYPDQARAQRLQGVVLLFVSVDTEGHVTAVRLSQSCGHLLLDRAALTAIRSWRFVPARQGERIISATVEVPIRFHFSN